MFIWRLDIVTSPAVRLNEFTKNLRLRNILGFALSLLLRGAGVGNVCTFIDVSFALVGMLGGCEVVTKWRLTLSISGVRTIPNIVCECPSYALVRRCF